MLRRYATIAIGLALLGSCGGDSAPPAMRSAAPSRAQALLASPAVASDYTPAVQELYISYYGRPADPAGLAYWNGVLLATGAPTDLQALAVAYAGNTSIKAVVDGFANSAESAALYGTDNPGIFVDAIYRNALGRPPDQGGLAYWTAQLTQGILTRGQTALAMIAAAAAQPSTSTDEQLVHNRLLIAISFTAQLTDKAALMAYSGSAANTIARSMLSAVSASTPVVCDLPGAAACNLGTVNDAITSIRASGPRVLGGSVVGSALSLELSRVTTLVGTSGINGADNGTGAVARFRSPASISTDGDNLYVADTGNNTIRQIVISSKVVSTIAGVAGTPGHSDGSASAALFNNPKGITTDASNLYITDSANSTIRKLVIGTGQVTTIAGIPGSSGSADGIGAQARFNAPGGITTDGRNLYVADVNNHTIRKIDITTGTVSTLAGAAGVSGISDGTGAQARFNHPQGITTDGKDLYVADTGNHTIRKIATDSGLVTTIAGFHGYASARDGTGSAALFYNPAGISTDGSKLYVADTQNSTIREIVIASGVVTTIAGSPALTGTADGEGTGARLYNPQSSTSDGKCLYVADTNNASVRSICTVAAVTGVPSTAPGSPSATRSDGQIIFGWTAATGATGYELYCQPGTIVSVTPGQKITTFTVSPYQLGGHVEYAYPDSFTTVYTCVAVPINDGGQGPVSSPITVAAPTCANGGTNYPTCTPPKCANGATDYPTCTPPVCANGATNYPTCTAPTCANGATDYPTCTPPGPITYYWANWNCGTSTQCASVMGGTAGSAGPMCDVSDCTAWRGMYISSAICSVTASSANKTVGRPSNGVCFKKGVDF